jgi:hypothetical protein
MPDLNASRDFESELIKLIIQYPKQFHSNTPPHLLARLMCEAIDSFEFHLARRADYFRRPTGIEDYPHDNSGSGFPG